MTRKQEIEKYLMPLLPEEPEEITATVLQREYKNGYLDGYKKAHDECDEIARELSQIKSGCSKWLDKHDAKIRTDSINEVFKKLYDIRDSLPFKYSEHWTLRDSDAISTLFIEYEKQLKEQESN